jgi:Lamin Tail Domain
MVHHRRCTFVAVALTMVVAVSAVAPASAAPALYRSLWGVAPIEATVANSSTMPFADPAFESLWNRTDALVARGRVKRGFYWGPTPYSGALNEEAEESPGGKHLVQYFDKGRMEINNPNAKKDDPFYVTNGLLAVELISGLQQNGVKAYQNRGPANINLASDADDPSAPTYQSFNGVSNIPGAPNERKSAAAVGSVVRTAIDRQGNTKPWPQEHPDYGVRIAYFEPATGHNVPDVFWDYLNQQAKIIQDGQLVTGPLFYPWLVATGYPISEPYWSYVKVAGSYTDVLIQAYERRVLTYVPHFQVGFKVQMGNIGQHYYDWRYLNAGGSPGPGPATPTAAALPPKASVQIDTIAYRKSLVDINGNLCIVTNAGQTPVRLDGWWLDSPKWDHVDRFFFPRGITLAPGASINVHSGLGQDTNGDIYMGRTTVMWDGMAYDTAILYDNYGREVSRFFPAAEVGATPTQPPPAPTSVGATATVPGKGTPSPSGGTVTPASTVTRAPSPQPTSVATLPAGSEKTPTATAGKTPTATSTVTP